MGKKYCSVYSCKRLYTKNCGFAFFSFPKDPVVLKKWLKVVGRHKEWLPKKNSRICSAHFSDVRQTNTGRHYLLEGGVFIENNSPVKEEDEDSIASSDGGTTLEKDRLGNSSHEGRPLKEDDQELPVADVISEATFDNFWIQCKKEINSTEDHEELPAADDECRILSPTEQMEESAVALASVVNGDHQYAMTSVAHDNNNEYLVSRVTRLTKTVEKLRASLKDVRQLYRKEKAAGVRMRKKINKLSAANRNISRKFHEQANTIYVPDVFGNVLDYFYARKDGKMGQEYTEEERKFCATLYSFSCVAYEFLRTTGLPFPHPSTLRKWAADAKSAAS